MNVDQRYRFIYKPLGFIAALIPFLWLQCGALGLFDVSLGADPTKKLEHVLGKTALNLLLLTLLVTPVRHIANLPHLPRFRRMLGLFAFFYATLHFIVYLSLDLEFNWHTVWSDIAKRPYITLGFTALVLMIPLAVTSTNRMMRRLGRRWQKLHRLVYPIAILGVWHYYWLVKRDVRLPLLYAGILAVLLGYRWFRARLRRKADSTLTPTAKTRSVTSTSAPATVPERT